VTTRPASTVAYRAGTTLAVSSAASLPIAKPAGLAAGDVMLATVSSRGAPRITPPAGWTQVVSTVNGTTMLQAVYVHVAAATEPATYTFTLNAAKAAVVQVNAYSGVNPTTPIAVSAGQANASAAAITAPAVTSAFDGRAVGLFGSARAGALTPAQGLVERTEVISNLGTSKVAADAADMPAYAGAVGPFTVTGTGAAASVGQTVVLRAVG